MIIMWKNVLLIFVVFLSVFSVGCFDEKERVIHDDGTWGWYHLLNPDLIIVETSDEYFYRYTNAPRIKEYNTCYFLFNYSSDGLRDVFDFLNGKSNCTIHMRTGNLTVYGQHGNHDCAFYVENMTNIRFYTDGLENTRFIVFEDRTVFKFNNITNCQFYDLNFTIINNISSHVLHIGSTDDDYSNSTYSGNSFNSIAFYHCYTFPGCSDYWYNKILNKKC